MVHSGERFQTREGRELTDGSPAGLHSPFMCYTAKRGRYMLCSGLYQSGSSHLLYRLCDRQFVQVALEVTYLLPCCRACAGWQEGARTCAERTQRTDPKKACLM